MKPANMAFTGRADGGILDSELDGADLGAVLQGFELQMFGAVTPIQTQLICLMIDIETLVTYLNMSSPPRALISRIKVLVRSCSLAYLDSTILR